MSSTTELDEILDNLGATLFCMGQDWVEGDGSPVDIKCEEAKSQIKHLILKARIDELEHVRPDVKGIAYVSTQENPHAYIELTDHISKLKAELGDEGK